ALGRGRGQRIFRSWSGRGLTGRGSALPDTERDPRRGSGGEKISPRNRPATIRRRRLLISFHGWIFWCGTPVRDSSFTCQHEPLTDFSAEGMLTCHRDILPGRRGENASLVDRRHDSRGRSVGCLLGDFRPDDAIPEQAGAFTVGLLPA